MRATKEHKIGEKHTIVVQEYATGREFNEIQNEYLKGANVNVIGGVPRIDGFNPAADSEANKKAVELLVVSLDGQQEVEGKTLVDRVLDLPYEQYNEVIEILNGLTGKKNSKTSNGQQ